VVSREVKCFSEKGPQTDTIVTPFKQSESKNLYI